MGQAKQRENNARDAVELIDDLIKLRVSAAGNSDLVALNRIVEEIELAKRALTDYLLQTDPRRGVYVEGEHKH